MSETDSTRTSPPPVLPEGSPETAGSYEGSPPPGSAGARGVGSPKQRSDQGDDSSPKTASAALPRRFSSDEASRPVADSLRTGGAYGGEPLNRAGPSFVPFSGVPGGMESAFKDNEQELLIPPLNFGRVCRGVYRSGFPGRKNFTFLQKLALHSVLNISEHDFPDDTLKFFEENNVSWKQIKVAGNMEPFLTSDEDVLRQALTEVLAATAQRPLLIHCTKGTHRTGCVVGCLRKLEEWSLTSIFDEYRRFAGSKVHILDQQFIEFFTPSADHRKLARRTANLR
mmetsp:Transcript_54767/g.130069  ORF Transcript_54767/g.130069 Transcript_54767/m.130069 type:complete len:283 (+) Transcript_54767:442-1290(+)